MSIKTVRNKQPGYHCRKTLLKTSKEYACVTTAHGIRYLVENGRLVIERMFWGIVVISAIAFTVFQMTTLYQQWKDYPVITTLDTLALPIEEIEFPAVTICPQGSIDKITESVLFKQFKEYILGKSPNGYVREKRSNDPHYQSQKGTTGQVPWNLSYVEMMKEAAEFLKDVYPGAKDKPTHLIRLLTSTDPQRAIQNKAVLYPSDEFGCDTSTNTDIWNSLNKELNNDTCPDDFKMMPDQSCLHTAPIIMTYDDAADYCNKHGGSKLLYFDSYESFDDFKDYKSPGTNFSNKKL